MAQADEKTKEFLLDLMQRIPGELVTIARETRELVDRARNRVDCAGQDIAELSQRLSDVETRIQRLCNVATQAINIKPMWKIIHEEDVSHSTDGEP